jgi:hypothetical protein
MKILSEQVLPTFERLGVAHDLLKARISLAQLHLARSHPGDRDTAAHLLRLARASAESLQVPEAARIHALQLESGLLPQEDPQK